MAETSGTLYEKMHPDCKVAWDKYESQYAGGMGGGRMTAMRAFTFAWDQALYITFGDIADRVNESYARSRRPLNISKV